MPRMLKELEGADVGLLGARTYWSGRVFMTVQYWRSAAELGSFARNSTMSHAPAWAAFNSKSAAKAHVGIFHETYLVPSAAIESLYGNMPPFGLGAALGSVERGTTRDRSDANVALETTEPEYVAVS
jgi:hypothetical protein